MFYVRRKTDQLHGTLDMLIRKVLCNRAIHGYAPFSDLGDVAAPAQKSESQTPGNAASHLQQRRRIRARGVPGRKIASDDT